MYRITGSPPTKTFPLPVHWWQGRGIQIFWDIYELETGCSRTSLNGNELLRVQRKLVRALCNYEFAKFAWTTLVRPNLRRALSMDVPFDDEGSDWILYGDMCRIDCRSSTLRRLARNVYSADKKTQTKLETKERTTKKSYRYNAHVKMDIPGITLCVGHGVCCNGYVFYDVVYLFCVSS